MGNKSTLHDSRSHGQSIYYCTKRTSKLRNRNRQYLENKLIEAVPESNKHENAVTRK